jgi:hypothetical protein
MNLPKLEGYVIYNPDTGMYSKGGSYGVFSPRPKIWSSIGAVKNHLALYINRHYHKLESSVVISTHYKGCVVLNLVDGTEPFKIHDYMKDKAEREAHYYGYKLIDEWTVP